MKAIFIVPKDINLPPMESEDGGPQFHYRDAQGNRAGGYSLLGPVPESSGVFYEFDSSPEAIAAWKAGGVYQWVKDVAEE